MESGEGSAWPLVGRKRFRPRRGVKCKAVALPAIPKKVPERAILSSGDDLRVGSFYLGMVNLGYAF